LRGHSRRFGIGGGLSFEGSPPLLQRPYFFFAAFFLVAFFLVAFFALAAMIKSPCRVSPGAVFTEIKIEMQYRRHDFFGRGFGRATT
jgi:hypothetical protein